MSRTYSLSRRNLLKRMALGASLAPLAAALARHAEAAPATLVSAGSPEGKAVQYTEDAKTARTAQASSTCANCALYQGASGSTQGPCQIFPGKEVKAAGWCSAWAVQM
jgi:anaerobic selenocysteine-containing dehydrogenase